MYQKCIKCVIVTDLTKLNRRAFGINQKHIYRLYNRKKKNLNSAVFGTDDIL